MTHITGTSATLVNSGSLGILIQVNTGFTGTITVADTNGTQAVVTNPVVGNAFRYYGLTGAVTVTSSATGDITVSSLSHQG